jgi:hypothetical protein
MLLFNVRGILLFPDSEDLTTSTSTLPLLILIVNQYFTMDEINQSTGLRLVHPPELRVSNAITGEGSVRGL